MMRQALASVLRGEAQLLSVSGSGVQSPDLGSRIDGWRHDVSAKIAEIRNLQEAVLYEFGVDHEGHKAAGETMLRAALSSGSLFWNELAALERKQDRDLVTREELLKIRSVLAKRLETMAYAIVEQKPIAPLRETSFEAGRFPADSARRNTRIPWPPGIPKLSPFCWSYLREFKLRSVACSKKSKIFSRCKAISTLDMMPQTLPRPSSMITQV